MAESPDPTPTPTVTDHRPVPRPALPRHLQTWLMAALAFGMLVIIFLTGKPAQSTRQAAPPPIQPASAGRVRDYQDRLRALEAQAVQEEQAAALRTAPPAAAPQAEPQGSRAAEDPIVAEKKRRDYESLFAGNVVMSRRPASERPDEPQAQPAGRTPERGTATPSIDEIADAAVRATARSRAAVGGPTDSVPGAPPPSPLTQSLTRPVAQTTPAHTEPLTDTGPLYRVLEGTLIDTVLTNRLDGGATAPVDCLVTTPLYSHTGQRVLIPAGARILGETKPVQAFGETRLAVAFHRLILPDGNTYGLNQFQGLNQIGDAGLRDKVNQHYLSTFGAAAAVGLISGFAQYLATSGVGSGTGDHTVVIAGGATEGTAQAAMQVMNRFLNRLPTITIREGHRVAVYVTTDFDLPAYRPPFAPEF
jgi:type IV secretion system protein TrbI